MITKDMIIQDIIDVCPGAIEVFMEYGFHCFSCMASNFETLEDGARAHGLSDEDIQALLEELQSLAEVENA